MGSFFNRTTGTGIFAESSHRVLLKGLLRTKLYKQSLFQFPYLEAYCLTSIAYLVSVSYDQLLLLITSISYSREAKVPNNSDEDTK